MSANLEISLEGRVQRVMLNRPEKRNALTLEMCRELAAALREAESNPGVGAVLLGSNGGVFCAGMDLDEALSGNAAEHSQAHEELFTIGWRLSVPVVAAVAGPALGGGLGLVANCHVAVAAQGATFGLTEIRLGMWPFLVYRAVALAVGERRALELGLTGRIFGAQDALAWGLVQHVVPAVEVDERAREFATKIAGWSPDTVRRGMAFVHEARGLAWEAAGEAAARARRPVFEGADFREGVEAFREKRPPRWPSVKTK